MITRFAIASIALGLLLLTGGIFLSEGYSAKRGFLESLSKMKIRITADEQRARFSQVLHSETAAGPLFEFEGKLIQMPHEMGDLEAMRVMNAFDAQRLGLPKPEHKYFFDGWAVHPGTTIPLGPVLAIASALVIIGAAVLVGARARHHQSASAPITSAEKTTTPEPSQPRWPIAISYVVTCVLYVFSQPPLTANPSPDQVLLGRLASAFGFGVLLLAGFVAGSIGGLIYKLRGRAFPWTRILWASLVIAALVGIVLTFGAWKAHGVLAK